MDLDSLIFPTCLLVACYSRIKSKCNFFTNYVNSSHRFVSAKMITRRCKPLQNPHFSSLHSLLFSTKPQKNPTKSTITPEYFVKKHQFSNEIAIKAASLLTHMKTPKKCDAVIAFFQEIGVSKMDLQNLVKNNSGRTILCADVVKTLRPKIKIFQDLGFSQSDIAFIVTENTWVLLSIGKSRIFTSLLVLKNMLGSVDVVVKLLKTSAWFIKHDLEKNMLPNIRFLLSCGIHMDHLSNHIFNFPRLLLHKPDKLRRFVVVVDEMRFNRESSRLYLYAITCVASMNEVTWKEKLELVRSLGFTEDEIIEMFQRAPCAFAVSRWKIKDVVQVISGSGLYELSDVVRHPGVLTSSIEKKLKPRLQVLGILKNKNLIKKNPALSVMYRVNEEKFKERFVVPYLDELGDVLFD